jgi:signal transduction histidine kinase/ligand-binding sensor domain-containing protein
MLWLFCGLDACQGADFSITTSGVDDGLPENGVTDVIQSPDGYLWISTLNSGVSRFDGVRFVNFDWPDTWPFAAHGVRRLFTDAGGTLWLNGFGNYIGSLRAGEFHLEYAGPAVINWLVLDKPDRTVFATKEGQLLERSRGEGTNWSWRLIPVPGAGANTRLFPDVRGDFWYRRADGKLARVTAEKAELISLPSGNPLVAALAADHEGTIALAGSERLFVRTNDHFQDITPTNDPPRSNPRGLASDGQGGWWVEADGRLRRFRGGQWLAESADWREQNRSWARVRWEQPDQAGGLWMAYTDGGILHVDALGKISALTTSDGLPSNRVRILTQDREGNVWASFERGGLVRIRPRLFQAVGHLQGLADSVTTSVCEDNHGTIWMGTLSGAVSSWHEGVCSNFTLPLQGTHCEMSTVFPDANGRVWIGTHGNGLLVYEDGRFRHVLSMAQVGVNIRGLFVSRDGRVWIASQEGLFCFAQGRLEQILAPKSEADYPTALAEGRNGVIWIVMNAGALIQYSGAELKSFQPANAAWRGRFAAVCEDAQGAVWIGTLGAGLLCFRQGGFWAITTRDGLPTDSISQVVEDAAGNLWLGSPAGVLSVPRAALEARLRQSSRTPDLVCRVFGRDDGLPTVGCATASQPTAWRGRDGRLWFATAQGVACVQPQDSTLNFRPPLVVLENLLVDGKLENPAGRLPARVKLSPGRHHLEFRYTGLSFAAPERVRFKYILEGLDTGWVENRAERIASYNAVPPGDYRFRVMACNSDGVWSETEAALTLLLPAPLWQTRWFRLTALSLVLVLVAGTVFWVMQIRHRRQLRALEQQRALERERTRIARDIHDDLGASLTRIMMLSQSALDKAAPVHSPNGEVNRIYATARAMTNAMDEIVWAINPRHDSLESVAAYFADFVEEFLSPAGLKFRLEIPLVLPPWTVTAETRHNLFLAFKEALNNALKHSRASEVVVTLAVREHGFILAVEDNGCGFAEALPVLQEQDSGQNGRGNGLTNMRRRLEEIGGRCSIESLPGQGTGVRFEVNTEHPV